MSLFHDVSNFAGSCQPVRNILHGQFWTAYTIFGAYFTCLLTSLSRMWLCANGSTGIIINIDTISNINLTAGMCHMEVDWFITYRIWWERFKNMHFFHATQWLFAYLICAKRVLIKNIFSQNVCDKWNMELLWFMCAIELMNRLISLKVIFVKKKRPHTNRRSQDVGPLSLFL